MLASTVGHTEDNENFTISPDGTPFRRHRCPADDSPIASLDGQPTLKVSLDHFSNSAPLEDTSSASECEQETWVLSSPPQASNADVVRPSRKCAAGSLLQPPSLLGHTRTRQPGSGTRCLRWKTTEEGEVASPNSNSAEMLETSLLLTRIDDHQPLAGRTEPISPGDATPFEQGCLKNGIQTPVYSPEQFCELRPQSDKRVVSSEVLITNREPVPQPQLSIQVVEASPPQPLASASLPSCIGSSNSSSRYHIPSDLEFFTDQNTKELLSLTHDRSAATTRTSSRTQYEKHFDVSRKSSYSSSWSIDGVGSRLASGLRAPPVARQFLLPRSPETSATGSAGLVTTSCSAHSGSLTHALPSGRHHSFSSSKLTMLQQATLLCPYVEQRGVSAAVLSNYLKKKLCFWNIASSSRLKCINLTHTCELRIERRMPNFPSPVVGATNCSRLWRYSPVQNHPEYSKWVMHQKTLLPTSSSSLSPAASIFRRKLVTTRVRTNSITPSKKETVSGDGGGSCSGDSVPSSVFHYSGGVEKGVPHGPWGRILDGRRLLAEGQFVHGRAVGYYVVYHEFFVELGCQSNGYSCGVFIQSNSSSTIVPFVRGDEGGFHRNQLMPGLGVDPIRERCIEAFKYRVPTDEPITTVRTLEGNFTSLVGDRLVLCEGSSSSSRGGGGWSSRYRSLSPCASECLSTPDELSSGLSPLSFAGFSENNTHPVSYSEISKDESRRLLRRRRSWPESKDFGASSQTSFCELETHAISACSMYGVRREPGFRSMNLEGHRDRICRYCYWGLDLMNAQSSMFWTPKQLSLFFAAIGCYELSSFTRRLQIDFRTLIRMSDAQLGRIMHATDYKKNQNQFRFVQTTIRLLYQSSEHKLRIEHRDAEIHCDRVDVSNIIKLGQGGHAIVLKACLNQSQDPVALKLFLSGGAMQKTVKRFLQIMKYQSPSRSEHSKVLQPRAKSSSLLRAFTKVTQTLWQSATFDNGSADFKPCPQTKKANNSSLLLSQEEDISDDDEKTSSGTLSPRGRPDDDDLVIFTSQQNTSGTSTSQTRGCTPQSAGDRNGSLEKIEFPVEEESSIANRPPSTANEYSSSQVDVDCCLIQSSLNISDEDDGGMILSRDSGISNHDNGRGLELGASCSREERARDQEFDLMAQIPPHPNVLKCLGWVDWRNYQVHGLLLEYCSKGALHNRVFGAGSSQCWRDCVHSFRDLAFGLAALHGVQIVHRDLKPSNYLVTADGTLKIADFGIAAKLEYNPSYYAQFGNAFYAAPEVLRGEGYWPSSDVFSFGVSLWEAVNSSGAHNNLRRGLVQAKVSAAECERDIELLFPLPGAMDPCLKKLISQSLCPDRQKRPGALAIAQTLDAILASTDDCTLTNVAHLFGF